MLSFIEAANLKRDNAARGVGNQGFRYAPNLVDFAHIAVTRSPAAYRFLKSVLPLPAERTLRYEY